ncbi:hypothetical protein GCM10027176_76350 [Actinoallomurus bryophytorum]
MLPDCPSGGPSRIAPSSRPGRVGQPFFKLNIGVALAGIGEHRNAAVMLREGSAEMPADQRSAEWVREYEALARAGERA